jgi:hypothetical protein
MRWIARLRLPFGPRDFSESLDVAGKLSAGLRDPASAQKAIAQLKDERKMLLRRMQVVEKQFRRTTNRSVRQSGRLGPQLGPYQMSQDVQNAELASGDSSRAEQVVAIERQIEEVDTAISQLRDRISQRS